MSRRPKILTKEDILRAMKVTKSNMHAARYLHVSYNHYKKYARLFKNDDGITLLEAHKNQQGVGIRKYSAKKLPQFNKMILATPKDDSLADEMKDFIDKRNKAMADKLGLEMKAVRNEMKEMESRIVGYLKKDQ